MIIIFIAFLTLIFSFNLYAISYQITGINRVVVTTPLSIFETSIPLNSINEDIDIHFDQEQLINKLDSYYEKSISRYTKDFLIDYMFYNPLDDSMCIEEQCNAIEVKVIAQLTLYYQYERTMFYEIRSSLNYGY